jgi:hypothetical protein
LQLFIKVGGQMAIGIPLEFGYSWWRVGLIIVTGASSGMVGFAFFSKTSLTEIFSDASLGLAGVSAGVHALLFASLPNLIIRLTDGGFQKTKNRFLLFAFIVCLALLTIPSLIFDKISSYNFFGNIIGALFGIFLGAVLFENKKMLNVKVSLKWLLVQAVVTLAVIEIIIFFNKS